MSRKLLLDQYLAVHGKIMAKNDHFFMEFWPVFVIFLRLRPYSCSKQGVLGFHKQTWWWAFFYPWFHHSWPGMAQKWQAFQHSTMTGDDQTWQAFQHSFWTISNKNLFFAPKHLCQTPLCTFGAKKSFLSEMVQRVQNGPKREVLKPTYPSLLWQAEWKEPAPFWKKEDQMVDHSGEQVGGLS